MKKERLRIVVEASIPYLRGVVEELGEVTYLPSPHFTREAVQNADWLIVRSITKCNASLLKGTQVKLITSATIGFDHIDTDFCQKAGIAWRNAPGCNAAAVGQYFGSVLAHWYEARSAVENQPSSFSSPSSSFLSEKTLGIVGLGHVGHEVARYARALGMHVLYNDPPLDRESSNPQGVSLDTLAQECDVITFHVPLTREGQDATYHLCDLAFVEKLQRKPLLINACRGAVTDTAALTKGYDEGLISDLVIDCWEGEPHISQDLLHRTLLATPHIAGFSAEGKANGSRRCLEQGIHFFGLGEEHLLHIQQTVQPAAPSPDLLPLLVGGRSNEALLLEAIRQTLDLTETDKALRRAPADFEQLRKDYQYPSEPSRYTISGELTQMTVARQLQDIGFQISPR